MSIVSLDSILISALPLASFLSIVLGWLMAFLSVFLILLILIQRGKGGGLTGALGGPGGQSAFGSKAGDTFTVITVATAAVWGLVCAFAMYQLGTHTPTIADTGSELGPGPGGEVEDITDGLVVPTMPGDDATSDSAGMSSGIGGLSSGLDLPATDDAPAADASDAGEASDTSDAADSTDADDSTEETP